MRVLVTGGAGFIGSHLAEGLLESGHRVDVMDDYSTGAPENLDRIAGHQRFELHHSSVLEAARLKKLIARSDVVVHLAASVGMDLVVGDPRASLDNNVLGVQALFAAAGRFRKPVLFASSSEVYGPKAVLPFREDAPLTLGPPTSPRWSYASAKALGEFFAAAHTRAAGVPVVVARLFNTVGPRQKGRYGMVLPRFCRQALAGSDITVHGDGSQTRCFAHVRDTAEALVRLIEGPLQGRRPSAHIVNVGSSEEIGIGALAELVRASVPSRSSIVHVSHADVYGADFEDVPRRVPDLSELERLTGFCPRTPLRVTVQDTLAALQAAPVA